MACAPTWSGAARAHAAPARRRVDRGGGHRCGGTFRPCCIAVASRTRHHRRPIHRHRPRRPCRAPGAHRQRRRAVGRIAGSAGGHGDRPRAAALAKSPEHPPALGHGCGCQSRPGALRGGLGGALSQGAERAPSNGCRPCCAGRPRQRRDLLRQPRSRRPGELWLVIVDASASTRRYGAPCPGQGSVGDAVRGGLSAAHPPGRAACHRAAGAMALAGAEGLAGVAGLAAPAGRRRRYAAARRLHQAVGWLARRQRQNPPSISVRWCLPTAVCATGRRCRRLPARACWSTSKAARCARAERLARELGPSIGISVN